MFANSSKNSLKLLRLLSRSSPFVMLISYNLLIVLLQESSKAK